MSGLSTQNQHKYFPQLIIRLEPLDFSLQAAS